MSIARCTAALAAGLAGLALAGCGDNYGGRVEINGNVKLKGQPLKTGMVMFEPLAKQDTRASAMITDGNYKVPRENGLRPGKYLIRVTAGDGKTPTNPTNPDEPPGPGGGGTNIISKELVPADWNTRSKQEREVTDQNPNKIDLDIP